MNKTLRSVAAAAAVVAATVTAVPAQAAVIVATFDPAVGPLISGAGFRGTAQLFVPDACFSLSGFVANSDTCSNNTMAVQSATLEFYPLSNPLSTFTTFNFGPTAFTVFAAEITAGELTGFSTSFADPAPFLELNNFTGTVAIRFALGDGPNSPGGVDLQLCPRAQDCQFAANRATNITFSRVPEPTPLSLLAVAALGAALASRRRKVA